MAQSRTSKPPNGSTLLVVDDEAAVLRALARDLRALGYAVVPVSDPSVAIAVLEVRRFDAVVTDLHLPTPHGQVFAAAAVRTAPETPVVVVTGEDSLRSVRSALAGTVVEAVLCKPYEREDLGAVLERAIVRARISLAETEGEARILAHGLVRALALRDIETENHSRRVAAWARILARAVGLEGAELLQAELGALLHDVGKIGVPDAVLRKPGKLSEEEWAVMRRHPTYGREMLAGIVALTGASDVVYSHHERWDGAGYPRRLRGEDIPIGARVFAVVDTYDAMTTDRIYRKALGHDAAVAEIRRLSGVQYDPAVAAAFLNIDQHRWRSVRRRFEDMFQSAVAA